MTIKVACLDVYDPAVRELFNSVAPEVFQLAMADSHEKDEQMKLAEDADFIITGGSPVPEQMLRSMKKIKLIQKFGIGYDKIHIDTARELNIPVAIAAGCNKIPVAEESVALMLSLYRRIPFIDRQVRAGNWRKTHSAQRARAFMLYGKTIGIIGCGNTVSS
jgi:D-3-phosphoglycerate dehydrogenase